MEDVAKLRKLAEDIEFQNYIADVFRFLRDGIIAIESSPQFKKGTDCLSFLYSDEALAFPDEEDFEDTEVDEKNKAIAEVQKKITEYQTAEAFLTGITVFIRDLENL